MTAYVPRLSAEEVDARLLAFLRELRAAEQSAFLWFVDIMNRRLYRKLGYSTVQQYAMERLDFSRSRTAYFVRLASEIKNLPRLHAAMVRGEIGWSKAVLLLRVATRDNEKEWIEEARTCGRRELARRVKAAQLATAGGRDVVDLFTSASALQARTPDQVPSAVGVGAQVKGQDSSQTAARAQDRDEAVNRGAAPAEAQGDGGGTGPVLTETVVQEHLPAAATEMRMRLTPVQRGQIEALLEKVRKLGAKGANPELVREGLTLLALSLSTGRGTGAGRGGGGAESAEGEESRGGISPGETPALSNRLDAESAENGLQSGVLSFNPPRGDSRRTHLPIYQVYVRICEECSRGWMETSSGPRLLDFATLRAILCDARVSRPGEPNRHSIPPLLRRQALERDHYRCRAAGCGSHRFLNVHHLHAKEDGGKHTLQNVLTLCEPCHTLVHALRGNELALHVEAREMFGRVSAQERLSQTTPTQAR